MDSLSKYNYVSFDIFDTLIKRLTKNVNEKLVLVQKEYKKIFGSKKIIENFPNVRIEAEKKARNKKNIEITLDDIYNEISSDYGYDISEKYKSTEIQIELKVCVANLNIKKLFDKCLSDGKSIYITSDMYLPQNIIEKILKKNGYSGYKKIFLSSEYGSTKISGSLYDDLLQEEKIKPNLLIHIGDNLKSDVLNARKKGINTYYVSEIENKIVSLYDVSNKSSYLYRFINFTNPYKDIYDNFGYECFGPLLFGFVNWIKDEVRNKNIEKVFFFSRDGYIMKKVYDLLKEEKDPKSYYFYTSRRALQVASIIFDSDYESIMEHMFIPRTVSVNWILKKWGLEPKHCKIEVEKAGLKIDSNIQGKDIINNTQIKSLFNCLKEKIISNSNLEFEAFTNYLKKNEFNGRVAIVDIGWYGNMQNSLMSILSHLKLNVDVTGYYLGIVPDSSYQLKYNMHGYLFDKNKNVDLYNRFKYLSSMMELLFMAPHGSCKKYTLNDKGYELSDFEYKNTFEFKKINKIQNSAIKFIQEYKERANLICLSEKEYLLPLFYKLTCPDYKTAVAFGKLRIYDDKYIELAPKQTLFKCLLNPRKAIKDFVNVSWKMGYLKRIFRLPIRYDLITYKMRELYKGL